MDRLEKIRQRRKLWGPANSPTSVQIWSDVDYLLSLVDSPPVPGDAAERFMVHEPTMTVQCNDSRCPVGSTMVGWPHPFLEGCMYAATVPVAAQPVAPVEDASVEKMFLSGQCDNRAHSRCPYPDRCKCECHAAAPTPEAAPAPVVPDALGFELALKDFEDTQDDNYHIRKKRSLAAFLSERFTTERRTVEELREALREMVKCVEGLAGQQAMRDYFYETPLKRARKLIGEQK